VKASIIADDLHIQASGLLDWRIGLVAAAGRLRLFPERNPYYPILITGLQMQ
jgi:hypothetical protein